jgi:hypothetical protein
MGDPPITRITPIAGGRGGGGPQIALACILSRTSSPTAVGIGVLCEICGSNGFGGE